MIKKIKYNKKFILMVAVIILIAAAFLMALLKGEAALSSPERVLKWKLVLDKVRTDDINGFFRELPEYYMANNEHETELQREALAAIFALSDEIPNMTDKEIANRLSEIVSRAKSGGSAECIGWTRGMAILSFHLEEYFDKFYDIDNNSADFELYKELFGEIDSLSADVPNLSDLEIKIRIQYILAKLGDSHTYTSLLTADGINKVYPFFANSYEDGLWVVGVYREKYKEAINCKILEINNIPIDEIFERIRGFVGHEHVNFVKSRYGNYIAYPEVLFAVNIIENIEDEIILTLEGLDGNIKAVAFYEKIQMAERLDAFDATFITDRADGDKAFFASRNEGIWAEYIEYGKILFIRLNTFSKYEGKWEMDPELDPFDDIKEISSKHKIEKIVLDYRGNTGGWVRLDYPWQDLVIELAQEIPLFLALNWNSYSAAPNQALYFKNNTNAITIGLPPGSGLLGRMDPMEVEIPDRNFSITFSASNYHEDYAADLEQILNGTKIEDYGDNTIHPDIQIVIGILDYINKSDPVLEWIVRIE